MIWFQSLAGEKGGIEALVSALNAHRQVSDVQLYGCWALRLISGLSANQASQIEVNTISLL